MKNIFITVGVSGSGKSTWAREYAENTEKTAILERDSIRYALFYNDFFNANGTWRIDLKGKQREKLEKQVTEKWNGALEVLLNDPKISNIILSDTNLNKNRRRGLIARLESDPRVLFVSVKTFFITYEQAVKNDTQRIASVGALVIGQQMKQFNEQFIKNDELGGAGCPDAIIVDLDGTLSHHSTHRSVYDYSKVNLDDIDFVIADIISALQETSYGYQIIFVTGRPGSADIRAKTLQWLEFYGFEYPILYMRREGNKSPDVDVKAEIYLNEIAPYFKVQAVIEDRPRVCRMWRSLGLKVLQVGDPHVEF